jgi:LCP family protein required for cell wall assembly
LPDGQTRGGSLWKRILLGAFLIVVAAAGATSVAAFREVNRVVSAFNAEPRLDVGRELATADAGKPQTILLIGSDYRVKGASGAGGGARSDTIILIRLDPSKQATALLSIPRDLKVSVPGHGISKINEAYTEGGAKLTLATVKEITGLRINHVISVNFLGFVDAVNQLGCVYMDIDRRYYNSGLGPNSYAAINLQPGYQRMCGRDALSFVRFRHTDTDIVRGARQQEFLAQMKQQISLGTLFGERAKLLKIFGKYTRSDIRSRSSVLRLLKLAILSAGHPIEQIPFRGRLGQTYVYSTDADLHKMARQFIGVESVGSAAQTPTGHHRRRHGRTASSLGLTDSSLGRQTALQLVQQGARIPVYYPRLIGSADQVISPPRAYAFVAKNHKHFPAYRIVVKSPRLGQYWGLQGLAWKNPPILKGPHDVRHYHGEEYDLYYEGRVLRTVAWRTSRAVYWVENSLSGALRPTQMITIARTAHRL